HLVLPGVARAFARGADILSGLQAARVAGLVGAAARPGVPLRPLSSRQPEDLRQRAIGLLCESLGGETPSTELLMHRDLESLRGRADFRELVGRAGLERRYASVWHTDATQEAEGPHGLSSEVHLARCRELAAKGYRPAALSVAVLESGKPVVASAWHR